MRSLILSDLHLGLPKRSAGSAAAIRPLWRGFDHVVINGDLAEVHHPDHRSDATREVLRLADRLEADGIALTVLAGNHDPVLSDQRIEHLAGGRVVVTHGDALHPSVAPWSPARRRMEAAFRAAIAAMPPAGRDTLEARLAATGHAAFAEWEDAERVRAESGQWHLPNLLLRPWLPLQVIRFWRLFPRLAHEFLHEHAPEAQVIAVGHTHRAGAWRFGHRTVLNTGSFGFPGRPHGIVIDGDRVELRRIRATPEGYELGAPRTVIDLRPAARPAETESERPRTPLPAQR